MISIIIASLICIVVLVIVCSVGSAVNNLSNFQKDEMNNIH
jgi:hypothetical protein